MTDDEIDLMLPPAGLARTPWCAFDHAWYLRAYPDAAAEIGSDGFEETRNFYIAEGVARGHSPNMYFDEAFYRRRYPDITAEIAAGRMVSGYQHYCLIGYVGRAPHWLFDPATYAEISPELSEAALVAFDCVNLYDHYLRIGARQGRVAHWLFDPATYEAALSGTASPANGSAFAVFLGKLLLGDVPARTSIYFDPDWFAARYPDAFAATPDARCALQAYLSGDRAALRDPCPEFSEGFYRDRHPEAAEAVRRGDYASGYAYFLAGGVTALHAPSAQIDLEVYVAEHPKALDGQCRDAFAHMRASRHPALALPPPPIRHGGGVVQAHGMVDALGAWALVINLTSAPVPVGMGMQVRATFAADVLDGVAICAADTTAGETTRLVLLVEDARLARGPLRQVELKQGRAAWHVAVPSTVMVGRGETMIERLQAELVDFPPSLAAARVQAMLRRAPFTGRDTIESLSAKLRLHIEQSILCPPDGVVLIGWMAAAPGLVRCLRLHSGGQSSTIDLAAVLRRRRPDVLATLTDLSDLDGDECGLLTYLPGALAPSAAAPYLSVELANGEVGYALLPPFRPQGLATMQELLGQLEPRYDLVAPAFDQVFGPAATALNRARLANLPAPRDITFGSQPDAVMLSVIVPLYGRIDFLEYQAALFAQSSPGVPTELIYVLDQPERQAETELLAASVAARFNLPIRLILLPRNLGYAPANNAGLRVARGTYVALMNSDVFPTAPGWGAALVARLAADPQLGVVGALLLYEDGTVQHQGMALEPLAEFAGWRFPTHPRKGKRPLAGDDLLLAEAITGACMVLRRADLVAQGGLDEAYAVGDFEDADLCARLAANGQTSAVDPTVRMYHLERQSQAAAGQAWRMNLTLFNAWTYHHRWTTPETAA